MAEDKSTEPKRLSRRDFLNIVLTGAGAASASSLISACERVRAGSEYGGFYNNDKNGWLIDARKYEEWRELVGPENPHAEEGFVLVFVGGVYLPPTLEHFRTSPFNKDNRIERNQEAGGLLVINPVLVRGATFSRDIIENSLCVPSPGGTEVEDLDDVRQMWVCLATNELKRLRVVGHNTVSRVDIATGSAVTFANIDLREGVFFIPPQGTPEGIHTPYHGLEGFWRYAKMIRETEGNKLDLVDPGEDAVRWEGIAVLGRPISGTGVTRVGEIRKVKDFAEAQSIMARVPNPLES